MRFLWFNELNEINISVFKGLNSRRLSFRSAVVMREEGTINDCPLIRDQ